MTKKELAQLGRDIGITIKWNSEWQEFYVYPVGTGRDHPSAYFTNDADDALATAMVMAGA